MAWGAAEIFGGLSGDQRDGKPQVLCITVVKIHVEYPRETANIILNLYYEEDSAKPTSIVVSG